MFSSTLRPMERKAQVEGYFIYLRKNPFIHTFGVPSVYAQGYTGQVGMDGLRIKFLLILKE
jgi:hypothetical protein